jgi:BirA family biotin operon repressor/biotin-[acetyl-CoA-carboxylase] ligase
LYNISANTIFTGKTLVYLPSCHSTNDYAAKLLSEGNPMEGTLVITPNQTAGKGQRGNKWEAETGKNLTFSLIFKPSFLKVGSQFYLNIISSLAVRDTLAQLLESDLKVKWPNDIYLFNNKISGILIQNAIKGDQIGTTIIGIGINVNQEHFSDKKAISMKNHHLGKEFLLEEVLNKVLEKVEMYYLKLRANHFAELYQMYLGHLYKYNEKHIFKAGDDLFQGTIVGLDENGRLLILSDSGVRAFEFKEVEFLEN